MDIVLVNPQIPQNTGSIARTCAATETRLHLVRPLGFEIDDKKIRRAGLDYWPWVDLHIHESWQEFLDFRDPEKVWLLSTHGKSSYFQTSFSANDCLVFGSETKGLGQKFLSSYPEQQCLTIPMKSPHVRSLNLSNAVSIVLYHALNTTAL